MLNFLLRRFDDGGRGRNGLFNLAAETASECFGIGGKEFGSDGAAFFYEAFCFRDGQGLAAPGFSEAGESVVVSSLRIV